MTSEYAAFLRSPDGVGNDLTPPDSDFGPGDLVDVDGEPLEPATGSEPARALHCERCGHDWRCRRGMTPKRCSRCTSPRWAIPRPIPLPGNTCVHCGYNWTPRQPGHSPVCPACHTALWDGRARRSSRPHRPSVQEQIGLDSGAAAAQFEYDHPYGYREPCPHVGSTNPGRQTWLASYNAAWTRLMREDAAAGRAA